MSSDLKSQLRALMRAKPMPKALVWLAIVVVALAPIFAVVYAVQGQWLLAIFQVAFGCFFGAVTFAWLNTEGSLTAWRHRGKPDPEKPGAS
jgi:fatty acid desaturase